MRKGFTGHGGGGRRVPYGLFPSECYMKITLQAAIGRAGLDGRLFWFPGRMMSYGYECKGRGGHMK